MYGTHAVPRADLLGIFKEWSPENQSFIALEIFPVIKTRMKAAKFSTLVRENHGKDVETIRGEDGSYNEIDLRKDDGSFSCIDRGLKYRLNDDDEVFYADQFDLESVATEVLAETMKIEREKRVAALVQSTTQFALGNNNYVDKSGSSWATSTNPVEQHIHDSMEAHVKLCGKVPDTLVVSFKTVNDMLRNDDLNGRLSTSKDQSYQDRFNALAKLIGLRRILVGDAVYDTKEEGIDHVGGTIWSDSYATLCVTAPQGSNLSMGCVGRTFVWTESADAEDVVIETYRDEDKRSNMIRARQFCDENLIDNQYGYMIKVR